MWVIENREKVLFYQEFNVQVEGNLHGGNMSQPHFWKSVTMTLTLPK